MTRNEAIESFRKAREGFFEYGDEFTKRVERACADILGDYDAIDKAITTVSNELMAEIEQDQRDEAYQDYIDSGRAAEHYALHGFY